MSSARARTWISTAVLVTAAAGALLFAWFGIARKDEAARAKKAADARLYAFAPAKVKSLTVEAKGGVTRLARAGDGWRIEAPVEADAERAAVDALVERVADLRRKAAVVATAGPDDLARYGLARPRAKVSLTLDDGKVETFTLGDENAFDGTAFVRTTAGAVDLVAGDVKWAVDRSTFDLREKQLLPFQEKDLQRVEIAARPIAYTLVRKGERWRLAAPVDDRADGATVDRILAALHGLRATAFESVESAAGGAIQQPRWKVTLVTGKGVRRTLLIAEQAAGSKAPSPLRAQLEGSAEIASLPAGAARDLDQDLLALRDKTVVDGLPKSARDAEQKQPPQAEASAGAARKAISPPVSGRN